MRRFGKNCDMNSNLPTNDNRSSSAELGAILRATRENRGITLEIVAADLKIRPFYLKAIEEGMLSHLPGSAYVAGFLRVYSEYLGLDGEEIVRRFKLAGDAIDNQTDLELPSPVEDGRLPSAIVFLVGLLILVAAYGGWYVISVDRNKSVQSVLEPPNEIAAIVNPPAVKQGRSANSMGPTKPGLALSEGSQVLQNKTQTKVSEQLGKNKTAPGSVRSVSASSTLDGRESLTTQKKTGLDPLANVAPNDLAEESQVLRTPPQRLKTLTSVQKLTVPRRDLSAPALPESRPTVISGDQDLEKGRRMDKSSKQTGGNTSTTSVRIVVRATADSFIAVRTAENKPLFSQLMRPGDRYEVPSGANLILDTGNAGGLAISIGNKSAPALGFQGQIRRNILLNAINLLQGAN